MLSETLLNCKMSYTILNHHNWNTFNVVYCGSLTSNVAPKTHTFSSETPNFQMQIHFKGDISNGEALLVSGHVVACLCITYLQNIQWRMHLKYRAKSVFVSSFPLSAWFYFCSSVLSLCSYTPQLALVCNAVSRWNQPWESKSYQTVQTIIFSHHQGSTP